MMKLLGQKQLLIEWCSDPLTIRPARQVLWIGRDWLNSLSCSLPAILLIAFKIADPRLCSWLITYKKWLWTWGTVRKKTKNYKVIENSGSQNILWFSSSLIYNRGAYQVWTGNSQNILWFSSSLVYYIGAYQVWTGNSQNILWFSSSLVYNGGAYQVWTDNSQNILWFSSSLVYNGGAYQVWTGNRKSFIPGKDLFLSL